MSDLVTVVSELKPAFGGNLLLPSDDGYDEARRIHNGMVDKHPALIAQCRGVADVVDAVKLARSQNLEIAVRGGGHNVAGRATVDDGLMIDLSLMRSVRVDRQAKTARVEGGATWLDVNRGTQIFGLATTGGAVSTTGVAGLTLGGGLGWLMPKYGMALDTLLSVDLVTADGEVARAAADENPDLYWAVRGGGGNFGVAASFEFQLYEVGPEIIGGLVAYPLSAAPEVFRFFRDVTATLPDEVFALAGLMTGEDGSKLVAFAMSHCGSVAEGEAAARPIKEFGEPVMDALGPITYSQLNMLLDDGFPKGARNYWKSHFLTELTDEAIDTLVDQFETCPSPMTQVFLEHFHGAATRINPTETAFALRSTGYNLAFVSQWMDSGDDQTNTDWTRAAYAAMAPYVGSNRYVNYMDHDDSGDSVLSAVYGPNVDRLKAVKAKYDPENVFHLNLNIPPG